VSALFINYDKIIMTYAEKNYHRRSIRLKKYDYSQSGIYFVTLCVQDRLCLFGEVVSNEVMLNSAGLLIADIWRSLSDRFKLISLLDYIVMPNHFHGLIQINKDNGDPISRIIQYFKSFSHVQYSIGVNKSGWQILPGKLWQRNYYEHIIRSEEALEKIQEYIISNPHNWDEDKENPKYLRVLEKGQTQGLPLQTLP
jgi:putative transposase